MINRNILVIISLFAISCVYSYGQVTEGEAALRTHSADTLMGWKTGGVITAAISQTSLTNWVTGGQNSL